MSRGYVIYAEGEDYVSKAEVLKESIEYHTEDEVTICSGYLQRFGGDASFGKKHKIQNLWQIYWMSPYKETIVLDADMLFLNDYSYWWNYLSKFDLLFPDTILNYKYEYVTHQQYDKVFVDNDIRPTYEKMFYFKKSQFAQEFFVMLGEVTINYNKFSNIKGWKNLLNHDWISYPPPRMATSYIFPICIKMLGIEDIVFDKNDIFKYVDIKSTCLNAPVQWDNLSHWGNYKEFYIENFKQYYPLHYRNAILRNI